MHIKQAITRAEISHSTPRTIELHHVALRIAAHSGSQPGLFEKTTAPAMSTTVHCRHVSARHVFDINPPHPAVGCCLSSPVEILHYSMRRIVEARVAWQPLPHLHASAQTQISLVAIRLELVR